MENRERTLYIKSKTNPHDYWVFDLESIKASHHGYEQTADGEPPLFFVEIPFGATTTRFCEKDHLFVLYSETTRCYHILSPRDVMCVIVTPSIVSSVVRNGRNTRKACDWATVPQECKED